MLVVHFGAGNIGRGLVGKMLSDSGHEVCFVDVNKQVIDELNSKKSYTVVIADDSQQKHQVNNVWGINSLEDSKKVIETIAKADLVTTAVGVNILTRISKLIAEALQYRMDNNKEPLNVIACENMIEGSSFLKNEVLSHLEESYKDKFNELIAFPNSAIDRIVPIQNNEDPLLVVVEPFFEWVIDESQIIGNISKIKDVTYVKELLPFIERKLFTVNTGHASTAYLGQYYGLSTIKDSITDERVRKLVKDVLKETGSLLVKKYNFDENEHQLYINKIISRFENDHIPEDVNRVARSPIRKISENERLVKPAKELLAFGETPSTLAKVIASALIYKNDEDPEAIELQNFLQSNTLEETLNKYSNLKEEAKLIELIKMSYNQLLENK